MMFSEKFKWSKVTHAVLSSKYNVTYNLSAYENNLLNRLIYVFTLSNNTKAT